MHPDALKTLLLMSALSGGMLPHERVLFDADSDPAAGGGGGGGGGAPDQKPADDKRFTQADVDAAIAARFGREKKAFEKQLADAQKVASEKQSALEQQLADLTAKLEDAGKNTGEKELAQMKRDFQKTSQQLADLAKERDAAITGRDAAITGLRDFRARTELSAAFLTAKALPSSVGDAVDLLMLRGKVEYADDGRVSTIEYDGRVYDKIADAAKAFLASKPGFASHPGGGNGSRNTGSGAGAGAVGEDDMNVSLLLRRGLAGLPGGRPDVTGS